ncbi:MAG: anthranilate synthase component I family protein [Acidobacteria bacterium]|nr:anthranilate synthase component I family protein [Acidobacteriota bacterium]
MTPTGRKKLVTAVDTMAADLLTPLAVYLILSAKSERSFLLESVEGGEALARYSFIGSEPESVAAGGKEAFEQVRAQVEEYFVEAAADLPSFIGGAIGYLGFDACEWFDQGIKPAETDGECAFMFYRTVVAFDHARQLIKIISLAEEGDIDAAEQRNSKVREALLSAGLSAAALAPNAAAADDVPRITSNWARPDLEAAVEAVKEMILAGECYQVVLSQCFTRPTTADAVSIYRALRSINPSPYMFLLDLGDKQIIGASPEMLLRVTGRKIEYRPIAGTRRRGASADEDARLAEEMRKDPKEVSEHMMLVDLGRNDLGRVSEYGSVSVDSLMHVEKYSHVQHLVSSVSATLRNGLDRFDALAACFPAGTVSGAPKVRSIEIIRELEPDRRGVYAGTVGYFDHSGNLDACIAIRTVVLQNGVVRIQAGAGIVADSVPSSEFEETVNKAKGILRAIEIAEGRQ